MKHPLSTAAAVALAMTVVVAELVRAAPDTPRPPAMTKSDAFAAGKALGAAAVASAAASKPSAATAARVVPNFGASAPESSAYRGTGRTAVATDGLEKVAGCRTAAASDAYSQQDCNAVNYMSGAPVERFLVDPRTDPTIKRADEAHAKPPGATGTSSAMCAPVTKTIPGTFSTETCEVDSVYARADCTRTLKVEVIKSPSCTPGSIVGLTTFPWGYSYRSGADLYTNGLVVRAMCDPERADVRLSIFAGDVAEGTYGAGPESRPAPNPDLLPNTNGVNVGVAAPLAADVEIGVPGAYVSKNSFCNPDGTCGFVIGRGPRRFTCPSGTYAPLVPACTTDVYGETTCPPPPPELVSTFESTASATCYPRYPALTSSTSCTIESGCTTTITCSPGQTPSGSYCYDLAAGVAAVATGAAAGGTTQTFVFAKPRFSVSVADVWDNSSCAALKAKEPG